MILHYMNFSKWLSWSTHYKRRKAIKINTVVNTLNMHEVPALYIKSMDLPVDRWKLLKMSYFNDGCHNNSELVISDDEYRSFVNANLSVLGFSDIADKLNGAEYFETETGMGVVAEKEVKGAYYMIDAGGYLVDGTYNNSYTRIINCLTEPFSKGLDSLTVYKDIYESRYKTA